MGSNSFVFESIQILFQKCLYFYPSRVFCICSQIHFNVSVPCLEGRKKCQHGPTFSHDQLYSTTFFSKSCTMSKTASETAAATELSPGLLSSFVTAPTACSTEPEESSYSAPPHNQGCNVCNTLCNVSIVVEVTETDLREDSDLRVTMLWRNVTCWANSFCRVLSVSGE